MKPERPLLLFRKPNTADKSNKGGGAPQINPPAHSRQAFRLAPKLEVLQRVIDEEKFQFQKSAVGIEPEKTLVFEVSGDISSFYTAIKNLGDDVEWIFDTSEDIAVSEDFYVYKEDKNTKERTRDATKTNFTGKVYCILANCRAIEEMLSLWKQFTKDHNMRFPTGKSGLRDVFIHLVDIHFWGYKERIEETGILDAWKEDLQDPDLPEVKCEIELFYRKSKDVRRQRENDLISRIKASGGKALSRSEIDGINYHAVLASLPRQTAQDILEKKDVAVVSAEQVMFFQAVGQSTTISDENISDSTIKVDTPSDIDDEPIIALFDGLPQENHPYLNGLLNVDDPDNYAAKYTVPSRKHGTSMASLIAHGDISNIRHQVTHKIYVRPIMKSVAALNGTGEEIPDDILLVDKIHESVRRLFETEAGKIAPHVKVINLSIGIKRRIFYGTMSPLARLLDWLSYKYKVLFIVSAGNHSYPGEHYEHLKCIDIGISFSDYVKLSMKERDARIVDYMDDNARICRLLSPAESMNVLTIGALHSDESNFTDDARQILPCSNMMVSPISAIGRGLNNSVKPDIIYPGGRNTWLQSFAVTNGFRWRDSLAREPGTVSAAPFDIASGSDKIMHTFGTSNATALVSHEASRCYDTLLDTFEYANESVPNEYLALLIKAMLAHGAEWGDLFRLFCRKAPSSKTVRDYVHKFFGYGIPNVDRAVECAKNRISLIGYGELRDGEAHLFDLPLPFEELSREKILRRLTVTMAYFTPIVPSRQAYRSAQLWFEIKGGKKHLIDKRVNADWQAVRRGTLQHEIFENDDIVAWGEDSVIQIKVNCTQIADEHFSGYIPYGLIVSFGIESVADIDVYERIAIKIKPKVLV